jgi:hypothetical protein
MCGVKESCIGANLAKSRAYINNAKGLPRLFNTALNNIFAFKREPEKLVSRFDLYVVAYVQFFNATTEPCNGWTFARWFSARYRFARR